MRITISLDERTAALADRYLAYLEGRAVVTVLAERIQAATGKLSKSSAALDAALQSKEQ